MTGFRALPFSFRLLVAVGLVFIGVHASANTDATASLESTRPKSRWERMELGVNGWFYGPAIGNWDTRAPNIQGQAAIPMAMTTQFTLSVPLVGRFQAAVTPAFTMQPFEGSTFQLQNPSVGVQGDVIESKGGPFSYWARYEVVVPVTAATRAAGQVIVPQAVNVLSYQPTGSNWQFRLVAVPSATFFDDGTWGMNAYFSPQVHYIFSDRFRVVALLEKYMIRRKDAHVFDFRDSQPSNMGLGVRYTLWHDGLWFQPFLNFDPFGTISANTMHLSFFFGGRLL